MKGADAHQVEVVIQKVSFFFFPVQVFGSRVSESERLDVGLVVISGAVAYARTPDPHLYPKLQTGCS